MFAEKFSRKFERHQLINLVKNIEIKKKIFLQNEQDIKQRIYSINITLESVDKIMRYFDVSVEYIKKSFNDIFITHLVKTIAKHHKNEHKQNINDTIRKVMEKEKKIKEESGNPEDDEKLFKQQEKKNSKNDDEENLSQKEDDDENEDEEADDYNISKEEIEPEENKSENEEKNEEEDKEEEGKLSIDNISVEVIKYLMKKVVFDEKKSVQSFLLRIPLEQKGILLKK